MPAIDVSDLALTVELKTPRAKPATEQGELPELHLADLDDLCRRTRVPSDASICSRRCSSCSGSPWPESHGDADGLLDLVQCTPVKVFSHKRTRSVRSSPVQG